MESARKNRTRARLVEVAGDVFARLGYSATTHADLAASAGIGRTTFYEYFESKEDLLVHLVEVAIPELNDELFTGLEELTPFEQMSSLVVRMIEFVGTDALGLILHTEVARLPDEVQLSSGQCACVPDRATEIVSRLFRILLRHGILVEPWSAE